MQTIQQQNNFFKSFWMAGFECTDKLNVHGERVDFLKLTGHLDYLEEDYMNLEPFGIRTVREGVRWSQVEIKPYQYNWSTVEEMIEAAKKFNIQQIWDLCHFGYPDDLSPLHPQFAQRFVAFATAFVKLYSRLQPDADLLVIPINEVNFISWLGGDVSATTPYTRGYGWEVKYKLMQAYINAVKAMKNVSANVKIITSEPLINAVPAFDATKEEIQEASLKNEYQFQATDILTGRMCPELGGREEYIDIIGLNYYSHNQWIHGTSEFLDWKSQEPDKRFQPLHLLIKKAYQRYNKPVVITETSHPEEDRPLWVEMIGQQCIKALNENIPLKGICIYPVVDRPDWDNIINWHHSGMWDIYTDSLGLQRLLHQPTANAFKKVQENIARHFPFTCRSSSFVRKYEEIYS